ncbi:hypothetical protein BX616_001195 [Lobosporangium transversale]|uniref:Extracellular membrane protein CFEM domain-containing protein n=1 Tax=Lobosporangium transversale TaxID=64571 RepID=A0A1Y2GVH5_9FUNG|nr:hypothetical protein BCR41DRAFT_351173 [Lobosporangium transversale]KAF9917381.1 hypothetical protein BX616_001195 [Lobosporangium transversale]ORZ20049.1 hypothetical protein BCR41DRAFT_351173 [Lobosporangium transversale]|eukprot:XP_021882589.1 hypothetical protein BCR41DRAFT_351173 [Lobosporangium transversale]
MKFLSWAVSALMALATSASLASAQSSDPVACASCLQKALQALPACAGVQIQPGSVSPAYASCLCSSLSGAWIDSCKGASQCGSSVTYFKSAYGSIIKAAGLSCTGTPTFSPV